MNNLPKRNSKPTRRNRMASKIDKVLTQLAVMDERDQNTSKDIAAIQATLSVVVERSSKHEQTLYGEGGKNGITSDVKLLKKAFYGAQAVVVGAGTLITLFREQVGQFFGGKQ
jgi:hypothetical protein